MVKTFMTLKQLENPDKHEPVQIQQKKNTKKI